MTRDVAWRPDSCLLAFNDIDMNGIQQVFVSNIDGSEKSQVTHFDEPGFNITSLQWSPDGEQIAFLLLEESNDMRHLAIANISDDENILRIRTTTGVNKFWWASDDIVVADALVLGSNSNPATDWAVAWYDALTGKEIGKLNSTSTPNGSSVIAGPLPPPNKFGFFSDGNFYSYDINSLQIEQLFEQFTDYRYWISSPKSVNDSVCG